MSKLVKSAKITAALMFLGMVAIAQQDKNTKAGDVPKGWHLLDKSKDGYYGISLDRAYDFIKLKSYFEYYSLLNVKC